MPLLTSLSVFGSHLKATTSSGTSPWYNDSSSAHHAVTLNGSVTQSDEGNGVKAASFDGSTGYLSLDPQSGFVLDGAFAFDGFFNFGSFTGGPGSSHMLVLDDYITGLVIRPMYGSGNGLQFFIASNDPSGQTDDVIPFQFSLNQTYYIAVSRDNSGIVSAYVDGSLIGSFTNTNSVACNSNIVIGINTWGYNEFFTGKMYNVRLIKGGTLDGSVPTTLPTAVSGTQLLLNFGATAVPTVELPWYSDLSDAHHAVTLNGSVTQSDEGGGVKVAAFNGSGYLITESNASFDISAGDSTIEFWINAAAKNYETVIAGELLQGSGCPLGLHIHNYTDGDGALVINNGQTVDAQISFEYNIWVHIAVVISSGTKYVYKNGVLSSTTYQPWDHIDTIAIGKAEAVGFSSGFNGKIAGLRITNTAVYTSDFTVPITLPTAISGTQLLLNFGATAVPAFNDIFTDASIDGSYNITPYSYTTHNGRFYVDGVPYTGTHSVTDYTVNYDGYGVPYSYSTSSRDIYFIVGIEAANTGATAAFANGVWTITGDVDVSNRNLTSLNFAYCVVTGYFYCNNNQLTSLQGAPSSVGGSFYCQDNQLTSLQYAPSSVVGNFYCGNNQFTFPIISQDVANVYWEYANGIRKHATNHHYVHGNYYADVATLVSGTTVLYTASDSNSTANNITYHTISQKFTTNGSGVVTIVAEPLTSWAGALQTCNGAAHGNFYTNSPVISVGVKVFTNISGSALYQQDFSSWTIVYNNVLYYYSGGIISSVGNHC